MPTTKSTNLTRSCEACSHLFKVYPSEAKERKFCDQACRRVYFNSDREASRFWSKVKKAKGCWLWTGSKSGGRAYFHRQLGMASCRVMPAARFMWQLVKGAIPDGLFVLHDCPGGDDPMCVNPDHLWLGTHAENLADAAAKGQMPRGESHGNAKLTRLMVQHIRRQHATNAATRRQLAKEAGISTSQVTDIINRKVWRHVP